jgi:hypothetical protein
MNDMCGRVPFAALASVGFMIWLRRQPHRTLQVAWGQFILGSLILVTPAWVEAKIRGRNQVVVAEQVAST